MKIQHIGQRLKIVRIEIAHQSQEEFASVLCMTQSNLSMLETQKYLPSCMILYLLHETYGVNLNWLITGQGEMQNKV